MISKTFDSLGLKVQLDVPETYAEFDALAKKENAALDSGIKDVVYRSVLNKVRDQFTEALQVLTGIERNSKQTPVLNEDGSPKLDASGNPEMEFDSYTESEGQYVKRVVAKVGGKVDQFQHLIDEIMSKGTIVFDPAAREYVAGAAKKLAKRYTEAAQSIVDGGNAEKAAKKLSGLLGREVGTSVDELAAAIRDDQAKQSLANQYA